MSAQAIGGIMCGIGIALALIVAAAVAERRSCRAPERESERLSPRMKKWQRSKLLQPPRPSVASRLAGFALAALIVGVITAIYLACIALACIHR